MKLSAKTRRALHITLWAMVGLLLAVMIAFGAFFLWYRSEVGASNDRVDPEIIEALAEQATSLLVPTVTEAVSSSSTSTSSMSTTTVTTLRAPDSMNLVILGSDTRSADGKGGRSDTIILVHIDTANNFLSMLPIPRDLRVEIPGRGMNKINAAYAYGGAALLIRTIQSSLGIDLDHYVETDFHGFEAITDSLGGVYMDVDRTYDDGAIQLQPGYQLLDGQNALRFCRTRHDRNYDFGRIQRQQRFLSAVREQAMGWNLTLKLPSLIDSTFDNVDTDLSANDILRLSWWGVHLDGSRMKMATLVVSTGTINGGSYVLATDRQLAAAAKDFITPPPGNPDETEDKSAEELLAAAEELLPDTSSATPAGDAWHGLADASGLLLQVPTYLPPKCVYSYQRSYSIEVDGEPKPSVKVGYRLSTEDQYLGVGETTWLDAPLASPGKNVTRGDTVFTIVGTSTKTDHVWWIEDGILCWVTNTLMYELSREQLLAVAVSTVPLWYASGAQMAEI